MAEWTEAQLPDLAGKVRKRYGYNVILVTGGNAGLGFQAAKVLAAKNAEIHLAGRSKEKIERAADEIRALHPSAKVHCHVVDLAKLSSVKAFAESFLAKVKKLDVLINNAGVSMVPVGKTEQGWDTQLGTNHFGTVYLTQLLLPAVLAAAPDARIVFLSSAAEAMSKAIDWNDLGGASLTSSGLDVYGQSKLFNGLYAHELQKRLGGKGVTSFAVHPGFVSTEILGKTEASCLSYLFGFLAKIFSISVDVGVRSTVFAAAAPEAQVLAGKAVYIGPDQFNKGHTAPRKYLSKHYSEGAAERLYKETLELIRAKGFEVPEAQ